MLLRQSCRAGNSAFVMWSQICSKTHSLGAKTTLHLEVNGKKRQKKKRHTRLDEP